jgi:hypothetical protein
LNITSLPFAGIGNGMPPRAPAMLRPSSWSLARVAFFTVLSSTDFGYATVRCVG